MENAGCFADIPAFLLKSDLQKVENTIKMDKILVTGATGKYGFSVVELLVKNGVSASSIYAMARREGKTKRLKSLKVNIVLGNYDDYSSMLTAFTVIDKLLFVSSGEMENRAEQHIQVVNAAKESGVKHIFYTSIGHKTVNFSLIDFVLGSHLATEKAIKDSGMDYTILRNGLYMDLLPYFLGENVLENGIFLPAGEGKITFTLRKEMAETAAKVLASKGHKNKIYNISGIGISFSEIAKEICNITGKNITYLSPPLDTFLHVMTNRGMPKKYAKMIGGFSAAAREGELEGGNSEMERLLGRKPLAVKEYLEEIFFWKLLNSIG